MSETWGHLIELRRRILTFFAFFGLLSVIALFYAQSVYHVLALPFLHNLTREPTLGLIAIDLPSTVLVPMKAAICFSLYVSLPVLFYQLWQFISPGLYQHEKRRIWICLLISILLFYAGTAFAYYVALPMILHFLLSLAPVGVSVSPDIGHYFSFVMRLFFAFGFCFLSPIVILGLHWLDIVPADRLRQKRPYVIVAAFVLGMLLTPPDVLSQIMLAIPLWLLFELGLLLTRILP